MPELPEVEIVVRDLQDILRKKPRITQFHFFRKNLREQLPIEELRTLEGLPITKVHRRAKYIIFETTQGSILSHLGMTGAWRNSEILEQKKHDHIAIELSNKNFLIYSDPRRFGYLGYISRDTSFATHNKLKKLGIEPLSESFNDQYLRWACQKKRASIKSLIMDQEIIVGVGNIYASEALFLARIKPIRIGARIKPEEFKQLAQAIKQILTKAIEAGGSSIRDYKSAREQAGAYQHEHRVYNRANEKCKFCQSLIKQSRIGGRSSFWCPKCQK